MTTKETATSEIEAQLQDLDAEYDKRRNEIIDGIKGKISKNLQAALKDFQAVPQQYRELVRGDYTIANLLSSFGAHAAPKARRMGKAAPKISDDELLAFLDSGDNHEQRNKDIETHFGITGVTVGDRMRKLEKAGKAKKRQQGTANYWSRA